jgi:hypothetical protein
MERRSVRVRAAKRSSSTKRERLGAWPSFHSRRLPAAIRQRTGSKPSAASSQPESLEHFFADDPHSGIAPMIRPLAAVLVPAPLSLLRRGLGSAQIRDLICRRKAVGCVGESELGCSLWSAILPPGWSMLLICAAAPRSRSALLICALVLSIHSPTKKQLDRARMIIIITRGARS